MALSSFFGLSLSLRNISANGEYDVISNWILFFPKGASISTQSSRFKPDIRIHEIFELPHKNLEPRYNSGAKAGFKDIYVIIFHNAEWTESQITGTLFSVL